MLKYFCLALLLATGLQAEPQAVSAISYNIRQDTRSDKGLRNWDDRKNKVTDYLLKKKVSIIGLQEVRHNQLQDVSKALVNFNHIGVGRDDGKTRGEYSPIFYDTKVWTPDPIEQGTFWLSDTPKKPNSRTWGNSHTRICTWARLTHIKSRKSIYVYNTHWDHISQPSRVKSAELILQKIRNRSQKNEPFVLMGDFNATTDNQAVKTLLTSGIMTDAGEKQFKTSSKWEASLVQGLRIDHIFTSHHWKNLSVTVESNGDPEGNAASDHHPVVLNPTP
ncbi:MAG: endonuclease/exonuclease/phosphatase family protein [Akkermansiaceae bacterium]